MNSIIGITCKMPMGRREAYQAQRGHLFAKLKFPGLGFPIGGGGLLMKPRVETIAHPH